MTCPGCEFNNAPGASRCARCGASLVSDSSPAPRTIPVGGGTAARMQPIARRPEAATAVSDSGETLLPEISNSHEEPADAGSFSERHAYSLADAATLISPVPAAESAASPGQRRITEQTTPPAQSQADAATVVRTPGATTSMADSPTSAAPAPARSSLRWTPDFGSRYEVLGILGQGGVGTVYKARDLELDRVVALKLLRPDMIPDASAIQRFKQELLLASKVSHRNILRIHDLGDANGMKYISMAYIEGEDLHRLLARVGRLSLERALRIARQLAEALDAAHAEGVVHRDLKPQNIMLGASDQVYVMDFGLAKSVETDAHMTMTGQVVGTPQYMAPEQVEGAALDHRTDLYAFGLILDEMLTGDLVFKADSALQLMLKRVREHPRSPRAIIADLPEYVERIIMHCLQANPAARYQSAREILRDIDAQHSASLNFPPRAEANGPTWISGQLRHAA